MKEQKETKEEYEARQKKKEDEEKQRIEDAKSVILHMRKANECPKCKEGQMKNFTRKNYPHGKKSKPIKTTGRRCPNCGYSKIK